MNDFDLVVQTPYRSNFLRQITVIMANYIMNQCHNSISLEIPEGHSLSDWPGATEDCMCLAVRLMNKMISFALF